MMRYLVFRHVNGPYIPIAIPHLENFLFVGVLEDKSEFQDLSKPLLAASHTSVLDAPGKPPESIALDARDQPASHPYEQTASHVSAPYVAPAAPAAPPVLPCASTTQPGLKEEIQLKIENISRLIGASGPPSSELVSLWESIAQRVHTHLVQEGETKMDRVAPENKSFQLDTPEIKPNTSMTEFSSSFPPVPALITPINPSHKRKVGDEGVISKRTRKDSDFQKEEGELLPQLWRHWVIDSLYRIQKMQENGGCSAEEVRKLVKEELEKRHCRLGKHTKKIYDGLLRRFLFKNNINAELISCFREALQQCPERVRFRHVNQLMYDSTYAKQVQGA